MLLGSRSGPVCFTQVLEILEVLEEPGYQTGVSWLCAKGSEFPRCGRERERERGGGGKRDGGRPQGVICVIYTSHEHRPVYNRACPLSTVVITHRYPS